MKRIVIVAVFYLVSWGQYEFGEWHWWSDEGFCTSGNLSVIGCEKYGEQGFNDIVYKRHTRIIRRPNYEGTVERIYRILPADATDIEIKLLDEKELRKL